MKLGFRGRLVAAAAIVSLATLGAAFAVVSMLVNRSQQRQLDEALIEVAVDEADELALSGDALHISDKPGPAANDVGPLPKVGAVYNGSGQAVSSTANLRGQPPGISELPSQAGKCFDFWFQGEHLRAVLVPIPSHPGSRLLLGAPRADLDGDAAFLTRAMLAVFAFAVAWTVTLALGIVGRLTRHHRVIAQTAKRVAGGDLTARVGSLGSRDDVAELGHNIDDMIERLTLLLSGQQQFIAHAAHELRSPLATLYGELSHALRRSRTSEEYRRAIEEALESTRTLKTLAEDLLSLARLGSEHTHTMDTVEVNEALRIALAVLSAELTEKQISVEVTCPPRFAVQGRVADLARMFRNLLENAVRHSPPREVIVVSVAESTVLGAPRVEITIADAGGGIAASERERIFDPFFRAAAVRAANDSGAGLGLTIARSIARLHGGDITLANTASQAGARFVVHLPAPPTKAPGSALHHPAPTLQSNSRSE